MTRRKNLSYFNYIFKVLKWILKKILLFSIIYNSTKRRPEIKRKISRQHGETKINMIFNPVEIIIIFSVQQKNGIRTNNSKIVM